MDATKLIQQARLASGLNRQQIAALAGVSTSTVSRIERGELKPTVDVVERLIDAAGFEFKVDLRPKSDPTAVAAARSVLSDTDFPQLDAVTAWLSKWDRAGLISSNGEAKSPRELAYRAARSSKLAYRPGIKYFERTIGWSDLGALFNDAGINWANTGDSAANRLYMYADQIWPVFYVEDVDAAALAGELTPLKGGYGRSISLIPFDGYSEQGRWQDDDAMWFADPIQVLIDCYAGTTRMPEQAEQLADMWDREVAVNG